MPITPYYMSLIDFDDSNDPIKKICIPSIEEFDLNGSFDTSGETDNTIITGVQHKYNQTVLLKGVNDDSNVLGELLRKIISIGIIPYYVFQCRPVTGVKNQFQVPLKEGYDIVERAKNLQNGQGKCFKYCLSSTSGKIEIVGKADDGKMVFKYHQTKYEKDRDRIFIEDIDDDQTWIY